MDGESFEKMIQQRKQENLQILKDLGLYQEKIKPSTSKPPSKKKANLKRKASPYSCQTQRRSERLLNKPPTSYNVDDNTSYNDDEDSKRRYVAIKNPLNPKPRLNKENLFGEIDGVPVGTVFDTRLEASQAGIHRPPVAGIHGNKDGCFSIALSGGYEDDVDEGEKFTYTGEGGRDLKGTKANPKNLRTASQSKDQKLERGNLALHINFQRNLPVRVLRGYKLQSKYAPEEGYRYDGLYDVVKSYTEQGKAGFLVYKYKMVRRKDQAPGPWHVCPEE